MLHNWILLMFSLPALLNANNTVQLLHTAVSTMPGALAVQYAGNFPTLFSLDSVPIP